MKVRRRYQAVVTGSDGKATPLGAKQVVEGFAAWLSETNGQRVCIQRVDGQASPEPTGVCYVRGVRQKRRAPRAVSAVVAPDAIPEEP